MCVCVCVCVGRGGFGKKGLNLQKISCSVIISVLKQQQVKVLSLSSVWLFVTPWTVAHQAPLSMEFSRQEYWNGLPFPSPGDLLYPGTKPRTPVVDRFLTVWTIRKALQAIAKSHHILLRSYFIFGDSDGKESAHNAGDTGLIPGSERWPGEGNVDPLHYSCQGNSMDRGVWWAMDRLTGRPGMLQSMGSPRVGHHLVTEQTNWDHKKHVKLDKCQFLYSFPGTL